MKRLNYICFLVVLVAAFGSTAKADNPANWTFSLETHGGDVNWTSPTNVDTGYPEYHYEWSQTHILEPPWPAVEVAGTTWIDIWGYLPDDAKSGDGNAPGLPFTILDESWEEPGVFGFDLDAFVDAGGWGHISTTNVWFGYAGDYPVTGLRLTGNATVEGVPEPATIALLGLGALSLLRRKRSV